MKSFTMRGARRARAHEEEVALPDGFPLTPREMPDPQPGDILLFTHAKGLNRLIPWFTGSRYFHCGVYEGEGRVLEARPNGVVRRDLQSSNEGEKVFRTVPMPEEGGDKAIHFVQSRIGSTYDPIDIAFIILRHTFPLWPIRYSNHRSFTCGELVARAWRAGGCDLFPNKQAAEVIPADFSRFLPRDSQDQVL
jgi:uncharacterized protein YycO